ncbi:MAG: sigma-54 dependent transcriptional regulator, partial [Pseudomonadota bacterium]
MPGKIMVVEDEENMRFLIVEALVNKGHDVFDADSAETALERFESFDPDLILMDIHLPGMSGLEAVGRVNDLNPLVPVIVITAFGSRDVALETIKSGAYDYFTKPFKLAELEVVVNRAIEKSRLQRKLRELQEKVDASYRFGGIIGQSSKMQHVLHLVDKVARSDSTVLILGESGTGKELVANAIHHRSPRNNMPLIKINCAAIPETLLESELFGHEKGAFTGAAGRKIGTFEQAHQGTLFLDEVGDMSLATQAKLLRVLEEKELQRVGGTHTLTVDVRVISATNQELSQLVKQKRFREDLFFRINTIPVQIPPLRERREDIPLLVDHFVQEGNARLGMNITGASQGAMER